MGADMNKIEQVARAISQTDYFDGSVFEMMWRATEHAGDCMNENFSCVLCEKEGLVEYARAAIEALMEPTEEMKAVGCIATGEAMTFDTVEGVYQAMLRNILEESDA